MRNKNVFLVLQIVCVLLLKSTRTADQTSRQWRTRGKRPTCRIRRFEPILMKKKIQYGYRIKE